jgi:DNA polymerase
VSIFPDEIYEIYHKVTKNSIMNSRNEQKIYQLQEIVDSIIHLRSSPLYSFRKENEYLPVIGEGNLDAEIMFIGEAPGKEEAKTGRPFVGRAGKLLDDMLHSIGLSRQDVYITNIVKDRPPKNRDPRPDEIEIYKPYLIDQIEIIKPKIIATLGRFSMNFIIDQYALPLNDQKIGQLHGKKMMINTSYSTIFFIPLYHPAAVFYNRSLQETLEDDFKNVLNCIEKTR